MVYKVSPQQYFENDMPKHSTKLNNPNGQDIIFIPSAEKPNIIVWGIIGFTTICVMGIVMATAIILKKC